MTIDAGQALAREICLWPPGDLLLNALGYIPFSSLS